MKLKELNAIYDKLLLDKDIYKFTSMYGIYINSRFMDKEASYVVLLSDALKVIPNLTPNNQEKYYKLSSVTNYEKESHKFTAFEDLNVYIQINHSYTYFLGKSFLADLLSVKSTVEPVTKFEIKVLIVEDRSSLNENGIFKQCPILSVMYKSRNEDTIKRKAFECEYSNTEELIYGIAMEDIVISENGSMHINNRNNNANLELFDVSFRNISDAAFFKLAVHSAIITGAFKIKTYNEK